MSTNFKYNSFARTIDGTNFCSGMETNAENVIEDNENEATIIFPSSDGWITQRTEQYRITDEEDNLFIILPLDCYKLKKVWLKVGGENIHLIRKTNEGDTERCELDDFKKDGKSIECIDISYFIVNEIEYNAISSTDNFNVYNHNNKKLKENCGTYDKNKITINGSYKLFGIGSRLIYKNIIASCLYRDYGTYTNSSGILLKNFLNGGNNIGFMLDLDFKNLKFRVEYIPVTSKTKLRARKSAKTVRDYFQPFNQRAEVNSAGAFGKSMYLSAQKTGVEEMTIVKNVTSLSEILPLGCRVKHDNKYYILTGRKIELTNTVYAKVTYTISQNWSNRSKHVSVDQKYRNYNIPNDIVWRNLYFEDFVDITAYSDKTNMETAISEIKGKIKDKYYYGIKKGSIQAEKDGIDVLSQIFYCKTTNDRTVNHFAFYNGSDNKEGAILPCTTMGIANSLVFNASMKDNLSAGLRMNPNDSTFCDETYYCNEDGTLTDNKAYIKLSCGINNFNANKYPASRTNAGSDSYNEPYSMILNEIFNIDKDPGEALKFTYQVHFVSDDPDIIIGNAIAEKHPLVKKYAQDTQFTSRPLIYVLLKDKIRQGEEKIQIESDDKAVKIRTETEKESYFSVETQKENGIYYGFKLTVKSNANDMETYSAWAILDDEKNILVACNDMTKKYLYFSHIHGRNQ